LREKEGEKNLAVGSCKGKPRVRASPGETNWSTKTRVSTGKKEEGLRAPIDRGGRERDRRASTAEGTLKKYLGGWGGGGATKSTVWIAQGESGWGGEFGRHWRELEGGGPSNRVKTKTQVGTGGETAGCGRAITTSMKKKKGLARKKTEAKHRSES